MRTITKTTIGYKKHWRSDRLSRNLQSLANKSGQKSITSHFFAVQIIYAFRKSFWNVVVFLFGVQSETLAFVGNIMLFICSLFQAFVRSAGRHNLYYELRCWRVRNVTNYILTTFWTPTVRSQMNINRRDSISKRSKMRNLSNSYLHL